MATTKTYIEEIRGIKFQIQFYEDKFEFGVIDEMWSAEALKEKKLYIPFKLAYDTLGNCSDNITLKNGVFTMIPASGKVKEYNEYFKMSCETRETKDKREAELQEIRDFVINIAFKSFIKEYQ